MPFDKMMGLMDEDPKFVVTESIRTYFSRDVNNWT